MSKKSNNQLRKANAKQTHHTMAFSVIKREDPKPKLRVGMTVEAYQERVSEWRIK